MRVHVWSCGSSRERGSASAGQTLLLYASLLVTLLLLMRGAVLICLLAGTGIAKPESDLAPQLPSHKESLERAIEPWLGTPYRYARSDRKRGTDCSGLTRSIAKEAFALDLPHSSREQFRMGKAIKRV